MTDVGQETSAPSQPDPVEGRTARSRVRGWLPLLPALVVSLVCHWLMTRGATGPVWMDDEVGYLADAAHLAGQDMPRFASLGYWGGWSLSLVPLYLVLDDAGQVYRGAVLVSALLGALVVLPAYALARLLTRSATVALVCAVVVTNVPDRTVMSGYALSENALVLATFTAAALVLAGSRSFEAGADRRGSVLHVGAAVACLAAFAVHARGAALVGAVALLGAAHLLHAGRRGTGVAVLGVGVVGAVLVYLTNDALVGAVYAGAAGQREDDLLATLSSLDPAILLLAASGQVWYQLAAWGGLSVAGFAVVLAASVRQLRTRGVRFGAPAWMLAATVAGTVISLVAVSGPISRGTDRVDFYFYGRYVTHLTAVLALVGLVWLVRRARARQALLLGLVVLVCSVLFLTRGVRLGDPGRALAPINVPAVTAWPWPPFVPGAPLPVGWITAAGLLTLLLLLGLRRWPLVLALVVLVASVGSGQNAQRLTLRPFDAPVRAGAAPLLPVVDRLGAPPVALVGLPSFQRNAYQFWLWPGSVRSAGRGEDLEPRADELVIAAPDDPRVLRPGQRTVVCDRSGQACLTVAPGPLQERLSAAGALEPAAGTVLPAEARRARLEVVDVDRGADGGGLTVRLTHAGGSAPWPALGSRPGAAGTVRVLMTWDGGSSLADLPRSLVPGDSAEVRFPLAAVPPEVRGVGVAVFVEQEPGLGFEGGRTEVELP